jgi:phosphomannomutase
LEIEFVKVSISGVRGIFDGDLSLQNILEFSRAFSQLIKKNTCVLARDTRLSSRIISETASAALMEQGIDVQNLGIAPTPFAFREARTYGAGLIVTASHNPLEWNGLKFILDGRGIFEHELQEMQKLVSNKFEVRSIAKEVSITSKYVEELSKLIGITGGKSKVAVDTTGGAASGYAGTILTQVGCDVKTINDVHGKSSRTPDPTSDELADLRNLVVSSKCDVGFAFDLDGDRLVVVDGDGQKLSPDTTLLLCASKAIEMGVKNIVISVDTSSAVKELASANNCRVMYSKVGEANVINTMLQNRIIAGGEGSSGGFIMSDFNMCRDGMLASAMITSILKNKKFDECLQITSKYHLIRDKVDTDSNLHETILDSITDDLEHECSSVDHLDGAKGIFDDDSWILLRGSNTEHSMRVSVESKNEDTAKSLYKRYEQKIREVYEKVKRTPNN